LSTSTIKDWARLTGSPYVVQTYQSGDLAACWPRLETFLRARGTVPLSLHPAWLTVLADGLQHPPYCLEALEGGKTRGFLALAHVRSWIFGRFLVSLPYLNYGGVVAEDEATARLLVDEAVRLADALNVRYLELRHERPLAHPALTQTRTDKVHMRLALPGKVEELWNALPAKVRNQIRKGQKSDLTVAWGGQELLGEFYTVFSHNMRDLGTPVYGRGLFRSILRQFPGLAELCVVRAGRQPVAAALLLHGSGITEVPSASSLRDFNPTCANMLLYWHLLERSVQRRQGWFDFGRSSKESNTFRFKKQWGAEPFPAEWQYYARVGDVAQMRTANPRYQRFIHMWQKLPVWLSRLLGPRIVRGIP
jgi:FemAB-related protein (PEP-CTERM system-associated)